MSWEFMLTPDDIVPIKTPFSNPSTVNVTVSEIISYGIDNNLGNAFMLIFDNPNGCMIRYFNVNGDTAYLATANYINDNAKIGIGEATNIQTIAATGVYCNNPWATPVTFGFASVAFNFVTKVVNGITYDTQGGYSMGAYHAIYVPPTVTNIYIDGSPLVTYTWSSVPAISGKNGILSLTTLKEESINDGSPVDDATVSAFNNAPNSCSVGSIISASLPIVEGDPTSVALKYNIPSLTDSTYTSVKLVAKKKKIPKSKTDGDRIIDISPSSGSVTVNNLDEQTKYYFVIFTEDNFENKADSEPKDITTGEKPKKWKETISSLKMITG